MFRRCIYNPILNPNIINSWESKKVYNCGVVFDGAINHFIYRAIGTDWKSRLGYAYSKNDKKFTRLSCPVFWPKYKNEKFGVEDPRITFLNDRYFVTYNAYDGTTARIEITTTKNFKKFSKGIVALPGWTFKKAHAISVKWDTARDEPREEKYWNKSAALFSEKIDEKYWMIFGDSNIWLAHSKDTKKWQPIWQPFLRPRKDKFDSAHIEMGPPPIKTSKGWLVIYHGIDKNITYRLGYVLLDLKNPEKIIFRSDEPIFEPKEKYEISGLVDILPGGLEAMKKMSKKSLGKYIKLAKINKKMPKVIFCCGAVLKKKMLHIYYGASDMFICAAKAKLDDILK